MAPVETDVGRALRAMALWRLGVLLAILSVIVVCLALFVALALASYLRGLLPLRTPLLP